MDEVLQVKSINDNDNKGGGCLVSLCEVGMTVTQNQRGRNENEIPWESLGVRRKGTLTQPSHLNQNPYPYNIM